MEIIVKAWTEESVTFKGEFFNFDEVLATPKPYQTPHPRVWYGSHSAESFEYAARMNFSVSQNIDIDPVIAEKFTTWRALWLQHGHAGPMPRTFLTRHVHVAESDEKAREQAEPHLATAVLAADFTEAGEKDPIAATRIGYGPDGMRGGDAGTPEREELRRTFRERARSYDFWIDNGIAIVGSPDTVARKMEEQHKLIGHDIFCARQRCGQLAPDLANKLVKLFAKEVMTAFA